MYSFGWRGLTIVDGAVINDDLARRLRVELGKFLRHESEERRWRPSDYTLRPEAVLKGHKIIGRVRRDYLGKAKIPDDPRSVRVSIGLDGVSEAAARDAMQGVNTLFQSLGISFTIQHLSPHRLAGRWKWPVEMRRMLKRGKSEVYVLLTASEWVSPSRGLVRGLANATVGAVMIQTGTPAETLRRLAHELGHLFGLPHTLLAGHVMYPDESAIGLSWSPGSKRLLTKNRLNARWYSSITSPVRFDIARRLAPEMRRAAPADKARHVLEAAASGDVWVSCGAG